MHSWLLWGYFLCSDYLFGFAGGQASFRNFYARNNYFIVREFRVVLWVSWVWFMPSHAYLSYLIPYIRLINYLVLLALKVNFKSLKIQHWLLKLFLESFFPFHWLSLQLKTILYLYWECALQGRKGPLSDWLHHVLLSLYFCSELLFLKDALFRVEVNAWW